VLALVAEDRSGGVGTDVAAPGEDVQARRRHLRKRAREGGEEVGRGRRGEAGSEGADAEGSGADGDGSDGDASAEEPATAGSGAAGVLVIAHLPTQASSGASPRAGRGGFRAG